MAVLEITKLRADIAAAGAKWDARELAPGEFQRGRGWQPTPPTVLQKARANAERLKRTRLASMFGATGAQPSAPLNAGVASGPAGGPGLPKVVDWRNQGVIAPVTDQERCGSCVSFAVTGLVGAMAAIEHDGTSIPLSQADSHFNSSHGPRCGGWDNGTALNQVQSRGVVGIGAAGGRSRVAPWRPTRLCSVYRARPTSSTPSASAPTMVATPPRGSRARRTGRAGGTSRAAWLRRTPPSLGSPVRRTSWTPPVSARIRKGIYRRLAAR